MDTNQLTPDLLIRGPLLAPWTHGGSKCETCPIEDLNCPIVD